MDKHNESPNEVDNLLTPEMGLQEHTCTEGGRWMDDFLCGNACITNKTKKASIGPKIESYLSECR